MTAVMTKQDQTLFQIKSGLAKLLATENIQVRHMPGAITAAFDVKNRQLFLPVWQNITDDLYDMLVVHEVGHALFTPADSWMGAVKEIAKRSHGVKTSSQAEHAVKNFMNVIEDARIDKMQKRKYPGSKRNYLAGYKELLERDFFGIKNKNVDALTFIDRANIYFKGGQQNLNIQFSPSEKVLISRMEKLETFEEVIALTEEVYNLSKANTKTITVLQNRGDEEDEDMDWDLDEDDETYMEADSDDEDSEEMDKISSLSKKGKGEEDQEDEVDGDDSEDDEGDSSESEGEGDAESEMSGSDKNSQRGGHSELDENVIPQCETEKHAEQAVKSIVANDDYNYVYLNIPKFNHDLIVDDFKVVIPEIEKSIDDKIASHNRHQYDAYKLKSREKFLESFNTWKTKEKDAVNYMIKEFEMRKSADTYSRQSVAKTGVIDTNKLHSYKFNDDIFRRLTVIPQGKNHGFVMLLDWSSSMTSSLRATMKQLFSLVMFCKKVQIPFEVYTFRMPTDIEVNSPGTKSYSYSHPYDVLRNKQFDIVENSLMFSAFKLRNVLSSRMNFPTLHKAYESLWIMSQLYISSDPMDSTPLNQAILAMDKIINEFRARNKLQIVSAIVLTDGGSDPVHGWHQKTTLPAKKGVKAMITDDVTKRSYFLEGGSYSWGYKVTDVFLNILRDRTGCNLIGFYLHVGKLQSGYNSIPGVDETYTNTVVAQEFWKKNNFLGVTTAGYDEYYIMNANALETESNAPLNVSSKMTSKKVVKELIKFFGNKTVNRVLLGRFINRIASERKRA